MSGAPGRRIGGHAPLRPRPGRRFRLHRRFVRRPGRSAGRRRRRARRRRADAAGRRHPQPALPDRRLGGTAAARRRRPRGRRARRDRPRGGLPRARRTRRARGARRRARERRHAARTVTHRAWDAYDEGLAILSRHPIAEVHVETLPPGAIPRKVLVARIERDGEPITFATTHLDHQDAAVRARQAAAASSAVATLAGTGPRVLVGDLNEGPGGGVGAALEDNAWADAWAVLHPGDPGPTFPASNPTARIDYVWIAGALAPQAIERTFAAPVAGVHASDHLGVRAVLAPPE
ncbi:MAG: endonuclease/exonuclease/phosphatase family protein [Deltaproteobacteria bacterium]|nr:endonuclease/exonuclease/phosphatase family protein [Kofleriaceae bacterium]